MGGIDHVTVGNVLDQVEYEADGSHDINHGNSFPVSPSERDFYYRDDLNQLYYYNGSSWKLIGSTGGLKIESPHSVDGQYLIPAGYRVHGIQTDSDAVDARFRYKVAGTWYQATTVIDAVYDVKYSVSGRVGWLPIPILGDGVNVEIFTASAINIALVYEDWTNVGVELVIETPASQTAGARKLVPDKAKLIGAYFENGAAITVQIQVDSTWYTVQNFAGDDYLFDGNRELGILSMSLAPGDGVNSAIRLAAGTDYDTALIYEDYS